MIKKILLFILIALIIAIICFWFWGTAPYISDKRINETQTFLKANRFNPDFCIFVDFSAYTGKKRFMLYSFKEGKVVYSCKCASGKNKSEFSNRVGSNLSSLGKYKIGRKRTLRNVNGFGDISKWNIPCYELHGLEKSNSNAYKRGILIHPDPLLFNIPIPILLPNHSQGCFSIPESSFKELDIILSESKKPILLIAFN